MKRRRIDPKAKKKMYSYKQQLQIIQDVWHVHLLLTFELLKKAIILRNKMEHFICNMLKILFHFINVQDFLDCIESDGL